MSGYAWSEPVLVEADMANKHALDHYDIDHHRISFNTKTFNLWWYKWDFDLIEEGLQMMKDDNEK